MSRRRVDHTKSIRQWPDEQREQVQTFLDRETTGPIPTRAEVLGAFPELWAEVFAPKRKRADETTS